MRMNTPLVHGCYDHATLKTLFDLGIDHFGFDLRGSSPNLVTFRDLKSMLTSFSFEQIVLTFENDKSSTVLSFFDLLKGSAQDILLEFRDQQSVGFYHSLDLPFLWMFHPEADWRNIVTLPQLKGILLPMEWKKEYQSLTSFWELIDHRNLNVFLHAKNFREAGEIERLSDVNLSLDLTREVENGFRCVDQERLRKLYLRRMLNENPSL